MITKYGNELLRDVINRRDPLEDFLSRVPLFMHVINEPVTIIGVTVDLMTRVCFRNEFKSLGYSPQRIVFVPDKDWRYHIYVEGSATFAKLRTTRPQRFAGYFITHENNNIVSVMNAAFGTYGSSADQDHHDNNGSWKIGWQLALSDYVPIGIACGPIKDGYLAVQCGSGPGVDFDGKNLFDKMMSGKSTLEVSRTKRMAEFLRQEEIDRKEAKQQYEYTTDDKTGYIDRKPKEPPKPKQKIESYAPKKRKIDLD